jgi:hypothetical protein
MTSLRVLNLQVAVTERMKPNREMVEAEAQLRKCLRKIKSRTSSKRISSDSSRMAMIQVELFVYYFYAYMMIKF